MLASEPAQTNKLHFVVLNKPRDQSSSFISVYFNYSNSMVVTTSSIPFKLTFTEDVSEDVSEDDKQAEEESVRGKRKRKDNRSRKSRRAKRRKPQEQE